MQLIATYTTTITGPFNSGTDFFVQDQGPVFAGTNVTTYLDFELAQPPGAIYFVGHTVLESIVVTENNDFPPPSDPVLIYYNGVPFASYLPSGWSNSAYFGSEPVGTILYASPDYAADQQFADANQSKADALEIAHQDLAQLDQLNAQLTSYKDNLLQLNIQQAFQSSITIGQSLVVLGDLAEIGLDLIAPEITLPLGIIKNYFLKGIADSQAVANGWNELIQHPGVGNFDAFMFNVDKWLLDASSNLGPAVGYESVIKVGIDIVGLIKDAQELDVSLRAKGLDTDITILKYHISQTQNEIASLNAQENAAEALDPPAGPIYQANALIPHVAQILGPEGNLDGLVGQGMTFILTNELLQASSSSETVLLATGVEGISLLDPSQTVLVEVATSTSQNPASPVHAIIEGILTSHDSVIVDGNYGSYHVETNSVGTIIQNQSTDLIVQNVDSIVFDDNVITFDSSGNPSIALRSGVPPSGATITIPAGTSASAISNFNQVPFYDPLHGDALYFAGTTTEATAQNFIAAQDIVTTYGDAVSLANALLQNFQYVLIGYDQSASAISSASVQPQNGENFLLLFADLTGDHRVDSVIRLLGLDEVGQFSPSDVLTDTHYIPPTIVALSATSDLHSMHVNAGHLATITLAISVSVEVTGTPTLQLNDNEVASYTGGSGTNSLTFSYVVQPTDNVANLQVTALNLPSDASIVDGNGNSLSGAVTGDLMLTIAGKLTPATVAQEVNGLYVSLYGITATDAGMKFWENYLHDNFDPSITVDNAATTAVSLNDQTYLGEQMTAGSPIVNGTTYFATLYPTSMSDMDYVKALYQNMSNFIGTVAGDNYWFGVLQQAEATNGGDVIGARESIAGQFVHDFLSNDLTIGAAALNVTPSDYTLLVNGQQALLNRALISQDYANETVAPGGSIINFTTVTSPAFAAAHNVVAAVTSDPATVAVAITGINNAIAQQDLSLI